MMRLLIAIVVDIVVNLAGAVSGLLSGILFLTMPFYYPEGYIRLYEITGHNPLWLGLSLMIVGICFMLFPINHLCGSKRPFRLGE